MQYLLIAAEMRQFWKTYYLGAFTNFLKREMFTCGDSFKQFDSRVKRKQKAGVLKNVK